MMGKWNEVLIFFSFLSFLGGVWIKFLNKIKYFRVKQEVLEKTNIALSFYLWGNKSQQAKQLACSRTTKVTGVLLQNPGLLSTAPSWFPQREETEYFNEKIRSAISALQCFVYFKTNWVHTSMLIIPPQPEKCDLNHHQLYLVIPPLLGALCVGIYSSLCGNSWHKIDHVLIRLYQDGKPQSLNWPDLFLFLC